MPPNGLRVLRWMLTLLLACIACVALAAPGAEWRTQHAVFRVSGFDELPGWRDDDQALAWEALRRSCGALAQRESWRDVCLQVKGARPTTAEARAFFEEHFTPVRILALDAAAQGPVTGYYEPLLDGRPERSETYAIPVYGVPRDMAVLDLRRVPPGLRRAVVYLVPDAGALRISAESAPGGYRIDLGRLAVDPADRRLRLRLVHDAEASHAEPYPTRIDIESLGPGGLDAPVLAWVRDPLALYAMQMQGSGRIRMADGQVLRVQYAEQNGQPFRPMRVVARSSGTASMRGVDSASRPADEFEMLDDANADPAPPAKAPVMRSLRAHAPDPAVDAMVESLLAAPASRAVPPSSRKTPQTATPTARLPPGSPSTTPSAADAAPADAGALIARIAIADPSFVFFRSSPDQSPALGPSGALGVPLTAGRSVAVDPRVMPLGYPVYLSAQAGEDDAPGLRQLAFAQDTGGAIRGPLRLDLFWGFGTAAGQRARQTRFQGEMWVLLPHADVERLLLASAVTRGGTKRSVPECLAIDDPFCDGDEP